MFRLFEVRGEAKTFYVPRAGNHWHARFLLATLALRI